jgi:hypothetical protein
MADRLWNGHVGSTIKVYDKETTMDFGNIIETVIGLVFVYALFSLFASALQEMLATRMNRRGRLLEESLASMLDGARRHGWWWWRMLGLFRVSVDGWGWVDRASPRNYPLTKEVLKHGLIWSGMRDDRLPTAIDGDQFARALIEIFCRKANDLVPTADGFAKGIGLAVTKEEPQKALQSIVADASGDLDKIRQGLRVWFDTSQDRVTGWYQREVRKVLFCLGLVIAICFNLDSFHLARKIYSDSALQERLAAAEQRYNTQATPTEQKNEDVKTVDELRLEITELGLPIGWPAPQGYSYVVIIAGWIISAFAISLGAPFWFDLLNNVMRLRVAGPLPPSTATEEVRPGIASPAAGAGSMPAATGPRTAFERTGLSETDVRDLQLDLGMPQGLITGELDAPTRQAIRERQRTGELPVTGEVDVELLENVRKRRV